jgi:hypothetical protein
MSAITKMPATGAVEKTLIQGDLSALNENERLGYYKNVCESLGLNPLTKPFDYIRLNQKLVLYAKRDATDQLRKIHDVSIQITAREKLEDLYIVTAKARNAKGREDESVGAVSIAGLKGDALANAIMKAETKAKRRVTLSVCGLGMLDETEVETVPNVTRDVTPAPVAPEALPESTGSLAEYVVSFGKFKGQCLGDVNESELKSYVSYIEDTARKKGETIKGQVQEFIRAVEGYIEERAGGLTF